MRHYLSVLRPPKADAWWSWSDSAYALESGYRSGGSEGGRSSAQLGMR